MHSSPPFPHVQHVQQPDQKKSEVVSEEKKQDFAQYEQTEGFLMGLIIFGIALAMVLWVFNQPIPH